MIKHNIPKDTFIEMICKPDPDKNDKNYINRNLLVWNEDLWGIFLTYLHKFLKYFGLEDKIIICRDCNKDFLFSISEQAFFKEKDFDDPKTCFSCRKLRKIQRNIKG